MVPNRFVFESGSLASTRRAASRRGITLGQPIFLAVRSDDDPFLHQSPSGVPPVQPRVDHTDAASPAAAHPVLPRPTYWPAALAFGITLFAWGFITSLLISIIGVMMIFVSIGGWIGELLHEH